jgi:hypothetical protein
MFAPAGPSGLVSNRAKRRAAYEIGVSESIRHLPIDRNVSRKARQHLALMMQRSPLAKKENALKEPARAQKNGLTETNNLADSPD